MNNSKVYLIAERLVSCLTYPTCSVIGLIWLFLSLGIMKRNVRPFILYHIYQSIILWMLITACSIVLNFFINLIIRIPIVGSWFGNIILFFNTPIHFGLSLINLFIFFVLLYLMLGALFGRYTKLPFISKIVKWNIERQC